MPDRIPVKPLIPSSAFSVALSVLAMLPVVPAAIPDFSLDRPAGLALYIISIAFFGFAQLVTISLEARRRAWSDALALQQEVIARRQAVAQAARESPFQYFGYRPRVTSTAPDGTLLYDSDWVPPKDDE